MEDAPPDSVSLARWLVEGETSPKASGPALWLRSRQVEAVKVLLEDLSHDQPTFVGTYSITQEQLIASAEERVVTFSVNKDGDDSFLKLVLLFAQAIDISATGCTADAHPDNPIFGDMERMVRSNSSVRELIKELYYIPDQVSYLSPDWNTLRLHRLGTTSFIFRMKDRVTRQKLILKISHVLFTRVGPISEATRAYASEWGALHEDCPYVAEVYASGVGWVLEEYVNGHTLREHLSAMKARPEAERLEEVADIFTAVCEAVDALHKATSGLVGHGDLNPSNILITVGGRDPLVGDSPARSPHASARLIDMGRNLLASDTIGRTRSPDAQYVPWEVRKLLPTERAVRPEADYFSLGLLLAALLSYEGRTGFFELDERLFSAYPDFSRICANLTQDSPERRAQYVLGKGGKEPTSGAGLVGIGRLVTSLARVSAEVSRRSRTSSQLAEAIGMNPLPSLYVFFQATIYIVKIVRSEERNLRAAIIGPLRFLASVIFFYVTLGLLLASIIASRVGAGPRPILVQGGSWDDRLQVYMVSATFALCSFMYATRALGFVSIMQVRALGTLRIVPEFLLWLSSTLVLPLTVLALDFGYTWWPWCVAAGLLVIAANNLSLWITRWRIDRVFTGPSCPQWFEQTSVAKQSTLDVLKYWSPTLFIYALLCTTLALLTHPLGRVHDYLIDATAISIVNLVVLAYSQVWNQGQLLRSNISQYVVAGEILL